MCSEIANDRLKIEDLLFSRTDLRGVIQGGNDAFQKVSVYSWEKLHGAPHKIVRHESMPKGVFFKLWQSIEAGKPIAAYVQNMAEDNVPYWVFATLLPIKDGYVSLRVKPSAGILKKIIPIYEHLRDAERAGGVSPKQSADSLEEAVKTLGYEDYTEFMSFALRDELVSRERALRRETESHRDNLSTMLEDVHQMEQRAQDIEKIFKNTHQIPYNMRLQAGRLEGSDGPISVISSNHRLMTQKLEDNMTHFSADSQVGAESIRHALFLTCASSLAQELMDSYLDESQDVPFDRNSELAEVRRLLETYHSHATNEIRSLSDKVRRFGQQCRDMRRMMSGLELTRIMCKIERSKFEGDHAGLDEIVNRLAEAQDSLGKTFNDILNDVSAILDRSEIIVRFSEERSVAKVA